MVRLGAHIRRSSEGTLPSTGRARPLSWRFDDRRICKLFAACAGLVSCSGTTSPAILVRDPRGALHPPHRRLDATSYSLHRADAVFPMRSSAATVLTPIDLATMNACATGETDANRDSHA